MSFGASIGILIVFGCLVPGSVSWRHDWSLEVPENCPHQNNETHICSSIVSSEGICSFLVCCGSGEDSASDDGTDSGSHHDDHDSDGFHGDNDGDGFHGDNDGDHESDDDEQSETCTNGICILIRSCTTYKCAERCCDGFERDGYGRCRNETHTLECQNGGTLRRSRRGYYCSCGRYFNGRSCENPICRCENMGECTVKDGVPHCECPAGFVGEHCERAICSPACQNGGSCYSDGHKAMCLCRQGYVGKSCEGKYLNSELCPTPVYYGSRNQDFQISCHSDDDCAGAEVCCNEGSSMVCRRPEPTTCNHGDQEYAVGETYKPEPCMTCECQRGGRAECFTMACAFPRCPDDQRPIHVPGQCCMSCPPPVETCEVEGREYRIGETFQPEPCKRCSCAPGGHAECATMSCAMPRCPNGADPIQEEDKCCMSCPPEPCTYKEVVYANGASFYDECNKCMCLNGVVGCTKMNCVTSAPGCEFNGTKYKEGESFSLDCKECQCKDGKTICTKEKCGCALECKNEGKCEKEDGVEMCHCVAPYYGKVCEKKHVNSDKCPAPPKESADVDEDECSVDCEADEDCMGDGVCCMEGCNLVCRRPKVVQCQHDGRTFTPGETYRPSACETCDCTGSGFMACYVIDCMRPMCPGYGPPVTVPGECCPVCPASTCEYNGVTHNNGESFKDDCNTCQCIGGSVTCTEMACARPASIKCPTGKAELHVSASSSIVTLTSDNTGVIAQDGNGRRLKVRFDPPVARHCACYDSDRAVQWAKATVSNNGVVEDCKVAFVVKDTYAPIFHSCPEDMYVFDDEQITFKRPTYTDNVAIAGKRCGMDPKNRTYRAGTYHFKYEIWDYERNTAYCNYRLSVSERDTAFENLPQGLRNRSSEKSSVALIAAPIAGLLVFSIAVAAIVLCCRFRRAKTSSSAQNAQNRSREAYDNHIYAVPNNVMLPGYKVPPPNPPAYHSDTSSMKSEYAYLPPPEYKEVEELKAPVGYLNPDYASIRSGKSSAVSSIA